MLIRILLIEVTTRHNRAVAMITSIRSLPGVMWAASEAESRRIGILVKMCTGKNVWLWWLRLWCGLGLTIKSLWFICMFISFNLWWEWLEFYCSIIQDTENKYYWKFRSGPRNIFISELVFANGIYYVQSPSAAFAMRS